MLEGPAKPLMHNVVHLSRTELPGGGQIVLHGHHAYVGHQNGPEGTTILDAGSSQTVEWLNDCQRIINSGIDVLAYSTLDEKGTRSCITQANSMHIPIICILPCTPIGNNRLLAAPKVAAEIALCAKFWTWIER